MPDTLTDILRLMRLDGSIYFQEKFSAPWGMRVDPGPFAQFHMVVDGQCWIEGEAFDEPADLGPGDIVVFPTGAGHSLSDAPGRQCRNGKSVVKAISNHDNPFAGAGPDVTLICGHFSFDESVKTTFLPLLPPVLLLHERDYSLLRLKTILNLIFEETRQPKDGGPVVAERLAEALFIDILREYTGKDENTGLMTALSDRRIKAALDAVHADPAYRWTLQEMARQAGASRTMFATRFKEKMGVTPMDYLNSLRMTKALQMLRANDAPIIEVAENVGYASEASFNRAFKRQFGTTPGRSRRRKVMLESD